MKDISDSIKKMDLEFFGTGSHKITPEKLFSNNGIFLDIRTNEEVKAITLNFDIYGVKTVTIPTDEIADRLDEISKNKTIAIFCPGAVRASMIYIYLRSQGYENIYIIEGGFEALIPFTKPGKLFKTINKQ